MSDLEAPTVERRASPSAWTAAWLSMVVPGLGHLYAGRPETGARVLAIQTSLSAAVLASTVIAAVPVWALWTVAAVAQLALLAWPFHAWHTAAAAHPGPETTRRTPLRATRVALATALILGSGACYSLLVRTFVVRAARTHSESMRPTLEADDRFFWSRLPSHRPRVGDLAVHRSPANPRHEFVKRIVAGPGDVLAIRDKVLYVNDRRRDEPYVSHSRPEVLPAAESPRDNFGPYRVPERHWFMLGDARDDSNDSRFFGPVADRLVLGRPIKIYWPPRRAGALR